MKKIFRKLVIAFLLMNLALTLSSIAHAAEAPQKLSDQAGNVLTPYEQLQAIGTGSNLPSFDPQQAGGSSNTHPDAPPGYLQPGVNIVASPIYFMIDLMKYILSGLAILMLTISVVKLITIADEDAMTNAKSSMLWSTVGLIIVQFADIMVKKVLFGEQGEAFEDMGTSELFAEETVSQVRGIIGLANYFLGAVALLVIIIRGFMLLTSVGEEDAISNAKTHIAYALGALIVVGLSDVVLLGFVFPEHGATLPNTQVGKTILVSVTNFVSSFIAILAFLTLLYSGFRYVVSAGNEDVTEDAKKTALSAVLGLLLALGAYAIVQTMITLEPEIPEDPQEQVETV